MWMNKSGILSINKKSPKDITEGILLMMFSQGHSADFWIFLSLKKFDLFYFFISYSSCDEESIHQRIFFYVERDVCNKMLKFCAFYNFFSSFFHLNYCAGYTYHVKKKKMTKRQRIFFSFEWCVSNCKKKLPSCSYLLFKIVFLMASVSNLVFWIGPKFAPVIDVNE